MNDDITVTEQVIANMLTEDTGRAICDSGGTPIYDDEGNYVGSEGGYGRNFEQHKGKGPADFFEEPTSWVNVWGGDDFWVTIHVFHWMVDRLVLDEKLEHLYRDQFPADGRSHLEDMEQFPQWLWEEWDGERVPEPTGLYGDGYPNTLNTYNSECSLSQTLQFVYFELDGDPHVVLHTHNGADVRGGYSTPHVFNVDRYGGAAMWRWNDVDLACTNNRDHVWTSDDGFHFYEHGGTDGLNLRDIEHTVGAEKLEDLEGDKPSPEVFEHVRAQLPDDYEQDIGRETNFEEHLDYPVLVYDDETDREFGHGTLYCPYCKPPHELKPNWF
ncbi:MAG: hypothetical protein ABEN55_21025 [Bradymonadaceae bacterium]